MNKAIIISCIFASTLIVSACGNSNSYLDKKTEVKTTTQISTSVITTTSSYKSTTNSKTNSTTKLFKMHWMLQTVITKLPHKKSKSFTLTKLMVKKSSLKVEILKVTHTVE